MSISVLRDKVQGLPLLERDALFGTSANMDPVTVGIVTFPSNGISSLLQRGLTRRGEDSRCKRPDEEAAVDYSGRRDDGSECGGGSTGGGCASAASDNGNGSCDEDDAYGDEGTEDGVGCCWLVTAVIHVGDEGEPDTAGVDGAPFAGLEYSPIQVADLLDDVHHGHLRLVCPADTGAVLITHVC